MDAIIVLSKVTATGLLVGAAYHMIGTTNLLLRRSSRKAWIALIAAVGITASLHAFALLRRYLGDAPQRIDMLESLGALIGAAALLWIAIIVRRTNNRARRVVELEAAVFSDSLTGLLNRRRFDMALPEQIELARRRNQPLSVLMIDIDLFKKVNDEHGHEWGDRVLTHLGGLLMTNKRLSDSAYRVGGEEFCVIAPGSAMSQACALAERLRRETESSVLVEGERRTAITISIGVASLRGDDSAGILTGRADHALYAAKRAGRNKVCTEDEASPTQAMAMLTTT